MLLWKSPDAGYFMSHEKKIPYSLLPRLQLMLSYESHSDSPAKTSKGRGGPATKRRSRTARGGRFTSPEQSSGGLDSQVIVQEDPQGSSQAADDISFGAIWPGLPLSLTHIPSFLSFIRACHLVAGHTIRCFVFVFLP